MSESILVAVPSDAPGGLDAAPSAHFGHCSFYTIVKLENGQIADTRVVANQGHEHGGCVQPVMELAKDGVKALLAGGMGQKPLTAMHNAGMHVFHCSGPATVREAINAFVEGKLPEFGADQLCKGCHGHH